jgi:hypothetical protein
MAEERLDLSPDYSSEAQPVDATERAPRKMGDLVSKLKRLRNVNYQAALIERRRKALMSELVPLMKAPVALLDPITGQPMVAVAQQAKPLSVSVSDLRQELYNHFYDEKVAQGLSADELKGYQEEVAMEVETIVGDVLKEPQVDTTEEGLFVKACEDGRIPVEVQVKVIKENPRSAFVSFPKAPKIDPKAP